MKIGDVYHRSVEPLDNGSVRVIDQRLLPWELKFVEITSPAQAATAIREMWVRGAPLIGAVAAYGLCLALRDDPSNAAMEKVYADLLATRPTAVNLKWALDRVRTIARAAPLAKRAEASYASTAALCDEDVAGNRAIGEHGLSLIREIARRKQKPGEAVNILTHCNAGWLATVDYGTALAPIYLAHDAGIPLHVWVDETRPRNQGMALTAWELAQHGVLHTVIADNAGGFLMREGKVDVCIVGADRVARNGDIANKIGTYLKALAAKDNNVPFYVALPHATLDLALTDGNAIPIEERDPLELTTITGRLKNGRVETVTLTNSPAFNPAFDITPAHLVTAFIMEGGVVNPQNLATQSVGKRQDCEKLLAS